MTLSRRIVLARRLADPRAQLGGEGAVEVLVVAVVLEDAGVHEHGRVGRHHDLLSEARVDHRLDPVEHRLVVGGAVEERVVDGADRVVLDGRAASGHRDVILDR